MEFLVEGGVAKIVKCEDLKEEEQWELSRVFYLNSVQNCSSLKI